MGGLTPLAYVTHAASTALPWAALALDFGTRLVKNRQQESAARAAAGHEIAQMRAVQDAESRQRAERLKRALATQRARFGAQGIDPRAGSAAALLDGLADEATREEAEARALAQLRAGGIEDRLKRQRRINLLEATAGTGRLAFDNLRRNLRGGSLLES